MLKQDKDDDRRRRTRAKVTAGAALAGHANRAEIEAVLRGDDDAGESAAEDASHVPALHRGGHGHKRVNDYDTFRRLLARWPKTTIPSHWPRGLLLMVLDRMTRTPGRLVSAAEIVPTLPLIDGRPATLRRVQRVIAMLRTLAEKSSPTWDDFNDAVEEATGERIEIVAYSRPTGLVGKFGCLRCGGTLPAHVRGPRRQYCSTRCANAARAKRSRSASR